MTLRVGILGCGNIFARGYVPALAEAGEVRVVAVCDVDPSRLATASASLPRADAVAAPAALLARSDLDAVFILAPTGDHAQLAIEALEAGLHVLVEKPMARTVADAERMAEAAERTGRRLMVAHARRFDERWIAVADQLNSGRIGDLVYAFRSEHAWAGAPADGWQWQDRQSGGVLWDVGIHAAELVHWWFRSVPATAYARLLYARPEAAAGGASDAAVVTYDFGGGRHATLSVSWLHPPTWAPFYATTDLVGTRGRIEGHDRDAHPAVLAGAGLEIVRHSPLLSATATTFRREVEHFASAVQTGAPFAITVHDALVAMRMIEAAERSAITGRPEAVG